jgi:hypothetical protein
MMMPLGCDRSPEVARWGAGSTVQGVVLPSGRRVGVSRRAGLARSGVLSSWVPGAAAVQVQPGAAAGAGEFPAADSSRSRRRLGSHRRAACSARPSICIQAVSSHARPPPNPVLDNDPNLVSCGEQWCPDCNRPCTRDGPGGLCPSCEEPVTVDDLLPTPHAQPVSPSKIR